MILKLPAIVLRTSTIRESDLLVTLIAQEVGKISVFARGAKKSKKRFSGGIDIFDYGKCCFRFPDETHHGGTIESIEEREHWLSLRSDITKFIHASLCLEITDAFLHESDPEGALLFRSLFLALRNIHRNSEPEAIKAISINYALEALQISGFDLLEHPDELPETIQNWFGLMNQTKKPIVSPSPAISQVGILYIKQYMENVLARKIRSISL